MRVALATEWFYPDVGGVATHVGGLARALAKMGHDVTILTPSRFGVSIDGYRVVTLRRLIPLPYAPPVSLARVNLREFDLVHAHHAFTPTPILSLLRASSEMVPCVVTNHTLAPVPEVAGRILLPLRGILSRARAVISVSRASASFISRIYSGPVFVIPNGVDTAVFAPPRNAPGAPRALFVGRLVHRKGVHVLIRAFRLVQREVAGAELVIAGKGPLLRPLRALARRLGVNAQFTGYVSPQELPELYRSARVFAMPSLYAEAFGVTALEAMASGLPVVATACGGLTEVVSNGETGLLVKPGDEKSLAGALALLLSDPRLSRLMGLRARRAAVDRFDWSVVAEKVVRVYARILSD